MRLCNRFLLSHDGNLEVHSTYPHFPVVVRDMFNNVLVGALGLLSLLVRWCRVWLGFWFMR